MDTFQTREKLAPSPEPRSASSGTFGQSAPIEWANRQDHGVRAQGSEVIILDDHLVGPDLILGVDHGAAVPPLPVRKAHLLPQMLAFLFTRIDLSPKY